MSVRPEIIAGEVPLTGREISRRQFLGQVAVSTVVITAGAGLTALAMKGIAAEIGERGSLIGEPIEGDIGELVFINKLPDHQEVFVRTSPTLPEHDTNVIGFAKDGDMAQARAYYGVTYPGVQGLGEIVGPDGNKYGKWFKIQGLNVYREKDGKIQTKVVHDAFVAGNFVRVASSDEKAAFYRNRE